MSLRFTKLFWKFVYFVYPSIRDFFLFTGIMHHKGRQPFFVGFLKKNISEEEFRTYLFSQGYEYDILAWIDENEALSLRKRVGDKYQYHLRLFIDKEIRAHFEIAPEYKPFRHINCEVFQEKLYFKRILADFLDE